MIGIFPNEDSITRLVGAMLRSQRGGQYDTLETIAPLGDDPRRRTR